MDENRLTTRILNTSASAQHVSPLLLWIPSSPTFSRTLLFHYLMYFIITPSLLSLGENQATTFNFKTSNKHQLHLTDLSSCSSQVPAAFITTLPWAACHTYVFTSHLFYKPIPCDFCHLHCHKDHFKVYPQLPCGQIPSRDYIIQSDSFKNEICNRTLSRIFLIAQNW